MHSSSSSQPARPAKSKRYHPPPSSLLYHSPAQEIFILDIPRSLELAQQYQLTTTASSALQQQQQQQSLRSIISCPPLRAPYACPPEPKSAKARKRVRDRMPVGEREFDEAVVRVVEGALGHVRARYAGLWCLGREVEDEVEVEVGDGDGDGGKRKRKREDDMSYSGVGVTSIPSALSQPPILLSPGINSFPDSRSLHGSVVKNPSHLPASIHLTSPQTGSRIYIPPNSTFLSTHLTLSPSPTLTLPKLTLLLFDPPWPNRSVRRSAHYATTPTFQAIQSLVTDLISAHLQPLPQPDDTATTASSGKVGIWTTNSAHSRAVVRNAFSETGLEVFEEWIWVKCTDHGEPVFPLGGLWRRTYEVLVWGRRRGEKMGEGDGDGDGQVKRRVIFAVPDVHSRKPGLKELVEKVFFSDEKRGEYTAMEVFARNLTAGWWAVGDEVWKFNCEEWWRDK